ncbi:MAG: bacillithiol biosynthesis cysteine-adding enzyme BshC, partial [Bacteroidota bacterium]
SIDSKSQEIQSKITFSVEKRDTLVQALTQQYKGFEFSISVKENIEALREGNSMTIVTGHQLCLAGGPLFLFYKISSVIACASELNKKQKGIRYIPVFWMASEDHDLKEISEFYFKGEHIHLGAEAYGMAGDFPTHYFREWLNGLNGQSNEFMDLLKSAYSKYERNADATRYWMNAVFGEDGLICIDANSAELKELARPLFEKELQTLFIHEAVERQNEKLKLKGFEPAINPRSCNLFLIQDGNRERLERVGDEFRTVTSQQHYSLEQLKSNLTIISPNVLCRPMYQECILPNVAYIGGPGELAYWIQLEDAFLQAGLDFPKLLHRNSATLIKKRDFEFMQKHQLDWKELQLQIQKVKDQMLSALGKFTTAEIQMNAEGVMEQMIDKAKEIDTTLEPWLRAELKKQLQQWQQIEGKINKAIQKREENAFTKLNQIHQFLLPNGKPQERQLTLLEASFYFDLKELKSIMCSHSPEDLQELLVV